ncbi:MAG: hypothetical protein HDR80_03570 [Bacteroides sp.]|nr:hypothetical protein [Bacteroides sp.]
MKRVIIIADGMADIPMHRLGGLTPLEAAHTPYMDAMATTGRTGRVLTVPPERHPGSETAILSILGYPSGSLPQGRGPLEALGLGRRLRPSEYAMRFTPASPGAIDFPGLRRAFPEVEFLRIRDDAGVAIAPVPDTVLNGRHADVTFWSCGMAEDYTPLSRLHKSLGLHTGRTVIIGATPLLRGIASAVGADWLQPPGATGDLATDYRAKGHHACRALRDYDTVILHIEACDCASHLQDSRAKIKAIENIDLHIAGPLFDCARREEAVIAVLPDHLSLCSTGAHAQGKVPVAIHDPRVRGVHSACFSEREAAKGDIKEIIDLWKNE